MALEWQGEAAAALTAHGAAALDCAYVGDWLITITRQDEEWMGQEFAMWAFWLPCWSIDPLESERHYERVAAANEERLRARGVIAIGQAAEAEQAYQAAEQWVGLFLA